MSNAKKDSVNPFFKKSYADINSIREAVLPALNAHGISVIQPTILIDGADFVETVLLHESGEYISSITRIVVDKVNDAQRHGSGLSYARRYALQSICNIGAEDDDGNKATGKKTTSVMIDPDVVDALTVLDSVTDLSGLAGWKKTFEPVLKDPAVRNAAIAKHSQLKTEAK